MYTWRISRGSSCYTGRGIWGTDHVLILEMVHSPYRFILLWTGIISAVSQVELFAVCWCIKARLLPAFNSCSRWMPEQKVLATLLPLSSAFLLNTCCQSIMSFLVNLHNAPGLEQDWHHRRAVQPGLYKSVWKAKPSHRRRQHFLEAGC